MLEAPLQRMIGTGSDPSHLYEGVPNTELRCNEAFLVNFCHVLASIIVFFTKFHKTKKIIINSYNNTGYFFAEFFFFFFFVFFFGTKVTIVAKISYATPRKYSRNIPDRDLSLIFLTLLFSNMKTKMLSISKKNMPLRLQLIKHHPL